MQTKRTIDEHFDWWIENEYPHRKYVNAFSKKWVKDFAQSWADYSNNWKRCAGSAADYLAAANNFRNAMENFNNYN